MTENEFKPIVKKIFGLLGFKIKDIPYENPRKTPDFLVENSSSTYTVELKIKEDDPKEIQCDNEILSKGELLGKESPTGTRNRLYGIIKDGADQIEKYDPDGKTLHVIWLHSAGVNPKLLNMRFHATIFGTQDLFGLGVKMGITCYYFNESVFFTCRNSLDAAILSQEDRNEITVQLCINTLSPKAGQFRKSDLYRVLSKGLCDPIILESRNDMIADCNCDRKDKNEIIKYLKAKYTMEHLQTIEMKHYSAQIRIPNEELEKNE